MRALPGWRLRALVFRRTLAAPVPDVDAALVEAQMQRATDVRLERGACLTTQGEPADAW